MRQVNHSVFESAKFQARGLANPALPAQLMGRHAPLNWWRSGHRIRDTDRSTSSRRIPQTVSGLQLDLGSTPDFESSDFGRSLLDVAASGPDAKRITTKPAAANDL